MTAKREVLATTRERDVRVVPARPDELPELLDVQHEAFGRVAAEAGVPIDMMPPATETAEQLEGLALRGMRFFVALADDDCIVGTVRGELVGDTVEVGRLAVRQAYLRRGVATALMVGLETAFPAAERFDLFTGADAVGPISLYEKLGYRIYATDHVDRWSMVRMAKSAREPLR